MWRDGNGAVTLNFFIMSDTKVYQFGTEGNASLNALLPFLQQKGIDPAILYNMGGNNGGFFGNNGFESIIALIIVAALFGNNNGNGIFGGGGNSNSAEREMLMSAIQRNGTDLSQLAQTIGCSTSRVHDAVTQVSTQICNLAGQNSMSFQQVINALQAGNATLATQLASCCCEIKGIMSEGFSSIGYALRDQTCNLEKAIAASTAQILEGQRAAEMRELQDKLDALREKNTQQAAIINNAQQTAQFHAMLAPIAEDVASIKCKLPKTETVPVNNDYVRIDRSISAPFCGCFGAGYGFPGFINGFNNAF